MKYRLDYCCNSSSSSFVCQRTHEGSVLSDGGETNHIEGFICKKCKASMSPLFWSLPSKEEYLKIVGEIIQNISAEYQSVFASNYNYWTSKKSNAAEILALQLSEFEHFNEDDLEEYVEDDHFKEIDYYFLYVDIPDIFCPYCRKEIITEKQYLQVLLSLPENEHLIIKGRINNTLNRNILEEKGFKMPYRTSEVISLCKRIVSMDEAIKLTESEAYKRFSMDASDFSCSDDEVYIDC